MFRAKAYLDDKRYLEQKLHDMFVSTKQKQTIKLT
jgi:hypothetical protein